MVLGLKGQRSRLRIIKDTSFIPTLGGSPYPCIENLQIHSDRVTKLLKDHDPSIRRGFKLYECLLVFNASERVVYDAV